MENLENLKKLKEIKDAIVCTAQFNEEEHSLLKKFAHEHCISLSHAIRLLSIRAIKKHNKGR